MLVCGLETSIFVLSKEQANYECDAARRDAEGLMTPKVRVADILSRTEKKTHFHLWFAYFLV
jgi:hypothetical protein